MKTVLNAIDEMGASVLAMLTAVALLTAGAMMLAGGGIGYILLAVGGGSELHDFAQTISVVTGFAGLLAGLLVMWRGAHAPRLPPVLAWGAVLFTFACLKAEYWWGLAAAVPMLLAILAQRATASRYAKAPTYQQDDRLSRAQRGEERIFEAEQPRSGFADVIGMDSVKERLSQAAIEIVQSEGEARNGILLFGEPGNGKTFFAEALAGEMGLPIIKLSIGDVASRWVNQTPEMIKQIFRDAVAQAPCVLFLDEVDSLLVDRAQIQRGDSEEAKSTNTLLTELVDVRRAGVVIVAATNFLEKLDPAASREGRFDFKIEVTPPDYEARRAVLRRAIDTHHATLEEAALELSATRWEGFSIARIRATGEEAAREACGAVVTYPALRLALRRVQGRAGALPEGTPELSELSFPRSQREALDGLAARLARIEEIEAMGGKVPSGVLFWGPPGTGKTITARALAKSAGWAFLSVSGNELLGDPDRIDGLVKEARDIRPVIVFIDEADDVLRARQFSHQGAASVTNRLLAALDGAGGKVHDIVWIAATNHPDQLDPAAIRGGRFGGKIEFALPDLEALTEFVRGWVRKSPATWAEGCDNAVDALLGLSLADVAEVLQSAANQAAERAVLRSESPMVSLEDVLAARLRVLGN